MFDFCMKNMNMQNTDARFAPVSASFCPEQSASETTGLVRLLDTAVLVVSFLHVRLQDRIILMKCFRGKRAFA